MFLKLKNITFNLFFLRFYLSFKPKFTCPTTYYYILGEREKYIFFNLSSLVETLFKLQKFIKYGLNSGNSFCFVSFNPQYFAVTKLLALETKQNYVVGSWVNSFFSRSMPQKGFALNGLDFSIQRNKMPIFIFITLENSENFFYELSYLHLPLVAITNTATNLKPFSHAIVCETFSLETVFFYSRLLGYFFLSAHDKIE